MKKGKNDQLSGRRRFLKQVAAAGLGGLVVDVSALESAVMQQPLAAAAPAAARIPRPSAAVRDAVAKRQPASTMRDPRNVFSGLIVDPTRNEVIMAEENNFSLMVYDREANTPPRAALSEPKRMIQGENTNLEYVCGVYVDPASGDIYGINNDTLNWMTVFDRNAKGNVAPNRRLATPHTTFGLVADEETQELLMTIQDDHAVTTFKKMAKDQEPPVRTLQGPHTMMADPHGIALDPKSGLIFVTNWGTTQDRKFDAAPPTGGGRGAGKPNWPVSRNNNIPGSGKTLPPSITVYHKDAKGDVAPLRVIQGPKTLLNWPTSIAVHPDRGEIFVANDPSDTVTVYKADANGDVAPIRVIKGPKSLVKNPVGVALDLKNNELWVANFGSHAATVFPIDASGDAVPKRVIRSGPADAPSPMLSNPHTMSFDSKRGEMLVSNCVGHPQIAAFARTANGAAVPTRAIYGQKTTFTRTIHDMAYDAVTDEILVMGYYNFGILTFRGDADGDVAPVRTIMGPKTQIVNPQAVSIDAVHGEIFIPQPGRVLVFQRGTSGDQAPIRILEGVNATRVTIDPVHDFLICSSSRGLQIFNRKASGNTKPLRIITGFGAKDVSEMTTFAQAGMIFAVVRPNGDDDISGRFSLDDFVGVWSVFDDGDVPARLTIAGPNLLLRDARGIAVDPKNKDVMVSDKTLNAIMRFHVPEAFVIS